MEVRGRTMRHTGIGTMAIEDTIRDILNREGVDEYGYVDQSCYDKEAPPGHRLRDQLDMASSAVVYLLPVRNHVIDHFPGTYAGSDYEAYVMEKRVISNRLHSIGETLSDYLQAMGHPAIDVPKGSQHYMGPVSLKHLAVHAGLGYLGKNSLLINPLYGPRLRIGAVITTFQPSSYGSCHEGGRICETCNLCIMACSAGALLVPEGPGKYSISVETCHSYFCDMRGILRKVENADVNCGFCMRACPAGNHAP